MTYMPESNSSRGKRFINVTAVVFASVLGLAPCAGHELVPASAATDVPLDTLKATFLDPPDSARPRVWWHWIGGNITQDGIAKDLAWMKRVGIGGMQNFDVGLTSRQIVEHRLAFMTAEWKDAFHFAASEAARLGLELAISSSPGWSETGGPWVQARDAMKKVVWSETQLPGGRHFRGLLAAPPAVTGPYQAFAATNQHYSYYADALVLAYPDAAPAAAVFPHLESAIGEPLQTEFHPDGSQQVGFTVASAAPGQPPTVVMRFDSPQTIRSATLFIRDAKTMFSQPSMLPRLEVRDGSAWRSVAPIPLAQVPTTISFAPVTASEFRLVVEAVPSAGTAGTPPRQVRIVDLQLSPLARVDKFEFKGGFDVAPDYYAMGSDSTPETVGVVPAKVIDITAQMNADGVLDWTPPPGHWRVLRLGYSLLGITNHPATPEATGLEVDKYDATVVRSYIDTYLERYREVVGPNLLGARGVQAIVTDSIEVGASNWTPRMLEQFQRLRGYDPRPWLPALTGVIVGSRVASDAFLYDFRRTLGDLIASEHYGQVARSAHEAGLKVYGESLEGGRPSLGDDMSMRSHADVPMAALWTFPREIGPAPGALADMRGAASVAHVYGQNLVAAESMTSSMKPWAFAPSDLRRIIDLEFASGVNRPVIHTSVHQPVDQAPGLSLSVFGQYFNRLDTWAEMARPWIDYISRTSYLLQQGYNVADVAYFSGEERPLTALHGDEPMRYAYDFVNADMLQDMLSVERGELVAKGGARYRLLYLGGTSQWMTLPVLRRLAQFAEAGATIVGLPPLGSPSLKDDPAEFRRLVQRLWPGGPVTTVGGGRVIASRDVEAALATLGVGPDFSYQKLAPDSEVVFVHRRLADGEVYYLNNRRNRAERIEAHFRISGKAAEIWHADTGVVEPVSYRIGESETVVPLDLAAEDSFFVVFRKPAAVQSVSVAAPSETVAGELTGSWRVTFQAERGAPASIQLTALSPLNEHADPGVKYFSGVATYTTTFSLATGVKPGALLRLDLGQVDDVAEVRVNGKSVGVVWKAPYRVDIGNAVKRGSNTLEVAVADLWVNRLIGDAQPGAHKVAFTIFSTYPASAPLRPSGLIGPVRLIVPSTMPH